MSGPESQVDRLLEQSMETRRQVEDPDGESWPADRPQPGSTHREVSRTGNATAG